MFNTSWLESVWVSPVKVINLNFQVKHNEWNEQLHPTEIIVYATPEVILHGSRLLGFCRGVV